MKPHILLVDDDRAFAESLADVLRLDGPAVDLAASGEEAVERFAVRSYDLIFLDSKLPGMNGMATILALRKIEPGASIYLISGQSVELMLDEEITGGPWRRLKKTFDGESLLAALERIKPTGLLLADDEPQFVEHLRTTLVEHGVSADVARSRREALDRAAAGKLGVLILDLRSTLLAGLEVYAELRQRRQLVPIILCSAYAAAKIDLGDLDRQLETAGILSKPFYPGKLLKALALREK